MMISEVHFTTGENVGVRVLYCYWEPSWCRWPVLPPMVMMVSTVHAASEGPVDIYIVCTASGDSAEVCGPLLLPETTGKSMIVTSDCEGCEVLGLQSECDWGAFCEFPK